MMNLWRVFYDLPQVPFYKEPISPRNLFVMSTNITENSTRVEIVTAALEVIDSQQDELQMLRERQLVLISLAGFLFIIHLLF